MWSSISVFLFQQMSMAKRKLTNVKLFANTAVMVVSSLWEIYSIKHEGIWHITHKSSNHKASATPSDPERGTWSPTSPKQSECCRNNKMHQGVRQQGILEVSKHTGAQIHHSLMASHRVLPALYQEPQRSRVHLTTQRRMDFTSCSCSDQ